VAHVIARAVFVSAVKMRGDESGSAHEGPESSTIAAPARYTADRSRCPIDRNSKVAA
jgi:hypothetical protein